MDILFLTVSIGGGHMSAANAIKNHIEHKFPGARTRIIDPLRSTHPVVGRVVIGSYMSAVKRAPQLYGKIYKMSENGDGLHDFSRAVNGWLSIKLTGLIREFNPAAIVCTHPFPLQMVSCLKAAGKVPVPAVAVLTDYVSHPMWIHAHTDAYVVAHEGMLLELTRKGVPAEKIYPLGIPVTTGFVNKGSRKELLAELQLRDLPTVLVMGGSLGLGEMQDTFRALLHCAEDIQIIVVTGHNTHLRKMLEAYPPSKDKSIRIYGYTDTIHKLMDISDLLISKPGGMTVSEALSKELPMCIISPIPGHEEGNAGFLVNSGVAVRARNAADILALVPQILTNPLRIRHMKDMARKLSRVNSCEQVVALLDRLINHTTKVIL